MKTKLLLSICIVFAFIFSCHKTDIKTPAPQPPGPPVLSTSSSPITASIQGNVFDENDQPVSGVSITIGAKTISTDLRGYFNIDNASLDKNASLLTGNKDGYFKIIKSFAATSGVNYQRIKLIKKKLIGTITASSGGTVSTSDGSSITLLANGLIKKSDNSSYNGTVNVYAASIDPTAQDIPGTIPGSLMGNDSIGKRVGLQSYGMIAVELESSAAEPLQIAAGKTATLSFAIPSSLQSSAPATIALWFMDDNTGLWKQQGSAVKSGSSYTGQVSHFSFWSIDLGVDGIVLNLTIKDKNNNPLPYSIVQMQNARYGTRYGYTDSHGEVAAIVPFNVQLNCSIAATWECINSSSQTIGPFTDSANIVLTADEQSIATVSGKVVNCNNVPLVNGYAIAYHNNTTYYLTLDQSGVFALTVAKCGSSDEVDIVGVDAVAKQQGNTYNIALSSRSVDAGNINACSVATAQFVKYTLDDVNYDLSEGNGIYLNAQLTGTTTKFIQVSAANTSSSSSPAAYFDVQDIGTIGSASLA